MEGSPLGSGCRNTSHKQQTRSVSCMRSTLLLRSRTINRNQRFITVHEERTSRSLSSSSDEDSDGSVDSRAEDLSTPGPVRQRIASAHGSDTECSSRGPFEKSELPTRERNNSRIESNPFDLSDGDTSEKEESVVDAVLAFQRWRQLNLKRSFSQELKKVLEEARHDEASLASMRRELIKKEETLTRALADSAHLRAHISAIEAAVQSQNTCSYNEDAQKQLYKAHGKVAAAEEEVQRRDKEIVRLKQRIQCLEGEKGRLDGNLQANLALLQREKTGALKENRALLDQLARKDQELTSQIEKADKLLAQVATMSEYHSKLERQQAELEAVQLSLRSQIKHEVDARLALEKDVTTRMNQCESLIKEKENLSLQLEKALERTHAVSAHDVLVSKSHCSSEIHPKSSEAIAAGILEHLKILTGHLMKLESSFGRNTRGPGLCSSLHEIDENLELALNSFRRSKAGTIETKLQQHLPELRQVSQSSAEDASAKSHGFSDQFVQTDFILSEISYSSHRLDESDDSVIDAKRPALGGESQLQLSGRTSVRWDDMDITLQGLAKWVVWKWRWVSAALKAKLLSKQLRSSRLASKVQTLGKPQTVNSKHGCNTIIATMEMELRTALPGQNLVPILLALWRAFRRSPKFERKAFSKNVPVDKVLAMLPWWIRRVGQRRRLERAFFQWHYLASCSEKRQGYQVEDYYSYPHSCYNRSSADEYLSVRRKCPKLRYQDYSSNTYGNFNGNGLPQQGLVPVRRRDLETEKGLELVKQDRRQLMLTPSSYVGTTFTARALRTLQVSLQQEFHDLQILLAKEMEAVQSQVAIGQSENENGNPQTTQRRRMTCLWEVCNVLANSLMDAHKQLLSLDREFNLRAYNYLELSANCEPKPSQSSPSGRPRAKSPTRVSRQIDDMHPLLRVPEDGSASVGVKSEKKVRPLQNSVNVITKKPNSLSRRRSCLASQCAAILQSEFKRYAQDKFDESTMVEEEIAVSPKWEPVRRPPWTMQKRTRKNFQ